MLSTLPSVSYIRRLSPIVAVILMAAAEDITQSFVPAVDFEVMQFSDNGTLSNIPLSTITSRALGCNESDWSGVAGSVVLVPYGNPEDKCSYYSKVSQPT